MSDNKIEQPNISTDSTKSIRAGQPDRRPVAGWRRWHFKSRFFLMFLGAVAIIVYLVCSGLAKQYEGLGAALCAVACGLFMVWHAIHLFTEQDKYEELHEQEFEAAELSAEKGDRIKE